MGDSEVLVAAIPRLLRSKPTIQAHSSQPNQQLQSSVFPRLSPFVPSRMAAAAAMASTSLQLSAMVPGARRMSMSRQQAPSNSCICRAASCAANAVQEIPGLNHTLSIRRFGSTRTLSLLVARATTENDDASEEADGEEQDRRRLEELEARLGLKRKSRRDGGVSESAPSPAPKPKLPAKVWDEMSFSEKAWELYIGEKGALFWLNKLAYASIFAIIGGWILFRFIGPALGWYELDSGLLPPSQLLSGTAGR